MGEDMRLQEEWLIEQEEWLEAIDDVLDHRGEAETRELLLKLQAHLSHRGFVLTEAALNTPYKNTIDVRQQPAYPGNIELEMRIGDIVSWNAVAMVLQALQWLVVGGRPSRDTANSSAHRKRTAREKIVGSLLLSHRIFVSVLIGWGGMPVMS